MSKYVSAAGWSTITHLSVVGSMLLRNIIFARFLSTTDFAIALTFGEVLSLFEYISNFGHENLMQRSTAGNQVSFQATMHSAMILRALIVAALIIVISPYIPMVLNLGNINFNYALLAIIPLINGFAHLDHQRLHRRQIYTLSAKIGLTADALSVLVAVACVVIWENYWAFYISFLFRHTIATLLSHIWARRKYALAFDRQHLKRLISFGLPLLIVGLLKYVGIETDKAIVARFAGLETFATYALTLMVVVNASNLVTLSLSKIFIRRVSLAKSLIAETVKSNGIIYCYLVIPILIALSLLGEGIISLIFGVQYTRIPFLILTVCMVVGIRSLNQWLNQTVIASAPTKLLLIADIARVFGTLVGVWLTYASGNVINIALAFGVAETLYFISLTLLLHRRFPIIKTSVLIFTIYFSSLSALSVIYNASFQSTIIVKASLTFLSLLVFCCVFLVASATCRTQSIALLRSISKRRGF